MTIARHLIPLALAALVAASAPAAHAAVYVHDARLVEPTASTHYDFTCHDGRPFHRVLVLTRSGHRFGERIVRHNGDVIWRDRRGHGRVKWTHRNTIINRAEHTALFIAYCTI
jgi:hypothetical protein